MDDFHKPRCKAGGERGRPTWERIGLQCCAWSVQRPPTPGVLESPADPIINIIMPRSDSNTRGVGGCLTNDSVKSTVQRPPATPLELRVGGCWTTKRGVDNTLWPKAPWSRGGERRRPAPAETRLSHLGTPATPPASTPNHLASVTQAPAGGARTGG